MKFYLLPILMARIPSEGIHSFKFKGYIYKPKGYLTIIIKTVKTANLIVRSFLLREAFCVPKTIKITNYRHGAFKEREKKKSNNNSG